MAGKCQLCVCMTGLCIGYVIEACLPTFPTIDVTHPGSPTWKTAITNSTKFAGKSFHAPLPHDRLTTLRAFPAELGLGVKCSSRRMALGHSDYVAQPVEPVQCHQLIYRVGISFTKHHPAHFNVADMLIRCSHHTPAMLLRHRWPNTEFLLLYSAYSDQVSDP